MQGNPGGENHSVCEPMLLLAFSTGTGLMMMDAECRRG